jgi:mannose-6-phosphate isomerase-like protein (cupin superfamily)
MQAFELSNIEHNRTNVGKSYLEFLRKNSLSLGLYVLQAGEGDPQEPHTEDEVYLVVRGNGQIEVAGESRPVCEGSIIYVPATVEHHFHSITEEISVLVFFAPAEYSNIRTLPQR